VWFLILKLNAILHKCLQAIEIAINKQREKIKSNMKTMIINSSFILVFIFFSNQSLAAFQNQKLQDSIHKTNAATDSLKSQIVKLQKLIEDGSYTRIPNKDFENIIDGKIEQSIQEIVKWWLFIIGVVFSVLGFFGIKYSNKYLENMVDTKITALKAENEETVKSISNRYFSAIGDSLVDFRIEVLAKKNHLVEVAEIDSFKNILDLDSITITDHKKVQVIDTIMRCYYVSNDADRINKMIDLIKEYEQEYTLLPSTYYNAAVAFSKMFNDFGNKNYLDSAIENCNKSINMLPDYGLAFGLKLELYMMAIAKAFDDNEIKHFKNELLKVFKDIENNKSLYLCSELIERLDIDKDYYFKPYIERLYKEYPDEMLKISARVTKPIIDEIV
jgi:hypothetical protein